MNIPFRALGRRCWVVALDGPGIDKPICMIDIADNNRAYC